MASLISTLNHHYKTFYYTFKLDISLIKIDRAIFSFNLKTFNKGVVNHDNSTIKTS